MRRLNIISMIGLLLCGQVLGETIASVDADDVTAVRGAATEFAVDAYLKTDKGDANFFFAPFSISTGLGVIYGGARGATEAELAKALQTDLDQLHYHTAFAALRDKINASFKESGIMLCVAKLVAHQKGYPLQESFIALTRNAYGSEIASFDFQQDPNAAAQSINAWAKEWTKGKITSFVSDKAISSNTRLAVLNSIYFKANWSNIFLVEETKDRTFWISEKRKTEVPTMYKKWKCAYGETPLAQVLEFPYTGYAVSMIIVLPTEREGLEGLERKLSTKQVVSWVTSLEPSEKNEIEIYLPKFEIETDMDLSSVLSRMGAKRMFSPAEADFSGMSSQTPLFVSTFLHRAGIKVNEEGSEAWTELGWYGSIGFEKPPPLKIFRADHPFLFFIMDRRNGVILFMGRVMNPKTLDRTTMKSTVSPEAAPSASPDER